MSARVTGQITIKVGVKRTTTINIDETLYDLFDRRRFSKKLAKLIRLAAKSWDY